MKISRIFVIPRSPEKVNIVQVLCIFFVKYFCGGPYRFLIVLLLGAAVVAYGMVYAVYIQKKQGPIGMDYFACIIVFSYLSAAYWYWNLIRLGKWKKIWRYVMHYFCPKEIISVASGNAKSKTKINALVLVGCVFLMFSIFAEPLGIPSNIKLIIILVALAFVVIGFRAMAKTKRQRKRRRQGN